MPDVLIRMDAAVAQEVRRVLAFEENLSDEPFFLAALRAIDNAVPAGIRTARPYVHQIRTSPYRPVTIEDGRVVGS